MTAARGPDGRDVVPRWRRFGAAVRARELSAYQAESPEEHGDDLAEGLASFENAPGIHTASDLVGRASTLGISAGGVQQAAKYLIASERSPASARELAETFMDPESRPAEEEPDPQSATYDPAKEARDRVGRMRSVVRREPGNAIRWADLALAHVTVGQHDRAERAIRVAVQLAPGNRHVLRSAARLYLHLDAPDKAHALLLREPAVLIDPWLLAAELALASITGNASRHIREARRMVDDDGLDPWHRSELASQLATTEYRGGRLRQARQHMRSALVDPTENALAQAQWAVPLGAAEVDAAELNLPLSYEARARRHSQTGEWAAAVGDGLRWQADQPFAVDPAVFTSFTASTAADDHATAAQAASRGLEANPGNTTLQNNLAFALLNLGEHAEAAKLLKAISRVAGSEQDRAVLMATQGLLAFRTGQVLEGRARYVEAVDRLKRLKNRDLAALAVLYWAREELLAHTDEASSIFQRGATEAKKSALPEVEVLRSRLQKLSHPASAAPNG